MPDIWKLMSLVSGDLELTILPGIGGRLWDVAYQGQSLLFQNPDLNGFPPDLENLRDIPTQSPQFGLPLWGGERTGIEPDTNWLDGSPYTALDPGPYEVVEGSPTRIALQSVVCPDSALQIEREIQLTGGACWKIRHNVTNHGQHGKDVGIWSVMMLNHKARIGVVGNNLEVTKVFGYPGKFVSVSKENVICDCSATGEFKVGIGHDTARAFMRFDQGDMPIWMCCESDRATPGDRFAHLHPFEVFNSGDYPYCEAEWHAPLQHLAPGETARAIQNFTVWHDKPPFLPTTIETELLSCMS